MTTHRHDNAATAARQEVLSRIRAATGTPPPGGAATAAPGAILRDYRTTAGQNTADLPGRLTGRLRDYGCHVHRVTPSQVPATVGAALARRGARRIAVPGGLHPPGQLPFGPQTLRELPHVLPGTEIVTDDGLPAAALDRIDGVITTAAIAIAETGTIILDGGPGQGRRALTLIPDYHLCILHASQIVGLVPEAIARLGPSRPLTWISGPSATSDIEFSRVEGVHGPRTLEVILVEGASRGSSSGSRSRS